MSEWISVKRSAPETFPALAAGDPDWSRRVLVAYGDAPDNGIAMDRVIRMPDYPNFIWETYGPRVTHWMPLPEPPK